ncbi:MAG TPA: ABC transporter permease [Bryobacteraceae bacterium]|nr:ABC transporter permease [Bryobacteraceae bacterium]
MRSLRQVFRRFGRAPMFTSVALITLALGIGANTAIFSVVNGVLLKPLPYPQANRLIGVWHVAPGISGISGDVNCTPTMYFTYREQNRTFQDFGLWSNDGVTVTGIGEPEQVRALDVTYGTLNALGVQPVLGRWFSEADDTPGGRDTTILTYGYWQRRFGGDKSVVGRSINIESKPHTIIGVMPQNFRFLNSQAELILPEQFDRNKIFLGNFSYQGIARLKPGVTMQQASTDVARMVPIWIKSWPPVPGFSRELFENAHIGPKLQPLKQEVVGNIGATLWVLMGTIGLVLLIACANVANLLLVRAESRQQELAVRAALGAGWGRIAREMLLESLTLGVLGGALGLALAYAALRMLIAKGPATLPRLGEIGVDPLVLGFTIFVSLLAGLFFGLIPAIKYAGPHVALSLRGSGSRSITQGRERHRARNTLVVVQVALALVLLIGSGLMIRTFQALRSVEPGFTQPEQVQLLRISIPESEVKDPERAMRMENDILDKLAAIPGVVSAAFASKAPLEDINRSNDLLYARDKTYSAGQIPPVRAFRYITPGFLQTVGTGLIAGRHFTWTDIYQKRNVAIVSANLAREMWGSPAAALGKQIHSGTKDAWREIVGVVADVYDDGVEQKPPATVYWPALMDHFELDEGYVTRYGVFAVRTNRAGTASFLGQARQAIWSVDPNTPIFRVRTLADVYDASMARTSFTLVLLAIAGIMALVLGVVGIYGVIAYAVTQRTREIGIRMALGAQPGGLQGMFVRQGLLLAAIGAVLGLVAAAGLTRLMSSILFKTAALDPMTYALVSAVLIGAAALASYVPARRATAIDPLEALRTE